jgi:hypothetical protein
VALAELVYVADDSVSALAYLEESVAMRR